MAILTDAKNFNSNGVLKIYNNEGSFLKSYETSIAPRRIVFQYDEKTVSVENEIIFSEFKLEQNYPNPFNPTTKIKYSIPDNEKSEMPNVKILIYDILGKVISTLVNRYQNPGNYEIIFNANNLPSGIYFYKLQAGNFISTKKMILTK